MQASWNRCTKVDFTELQFRPCDVQSASYSNLVGNMQFTDGLVTEVCETEFD